MITLMCVMLGLGVFSQEKYTDVIQKSTQEQGKLTLHQSQEITNLVNGTATATVVPAAKKSKQIVDTLSEDTVKTVLTGKKIQSNGYRIQVYSGDNSRRGKNEAFAYGNRLKNAFGNLSVYVNFISPHWVCRAGNFRTYEEAKEYFRQMKEIGGFPEAVIVRSKIKIQY